MKIKVTIKKESLAAKVVYAIKMHQEAFRQVVTSGKADRYNRSKPR